ncbi:bleomycin resistance protein [Nocardioides sp. Soil797]|nr:bleomycin resistance protein [Nocardioides sp. Soil797]
MSAVLGALCVDANDPQKLAQFWAGMLDREIRVTAAGLPILVPANDVQFPIGFAPTTAEKQGLNWTHFDLASARPGEQERLVDRALALGAEHFDVGQRPEEGHVVLADPEGNEFCVIPSGNNFLADTDLIGCLASDGTHAVGVFWSEALGWPLIWDEGEETAIQSPRGGSKISWGGPPVATKHGKNRLHLDLAPDGDQADEVARLEALGARRVDIGQGDVSWVVMADPDGNEFCVLGRDR